MAQNLGERSMTVAPQIINWVRARGIPIDPAELARMPLRWSPRCPLGRGDAPAMIALMTDPITAEPCGIHRTFLSADGSAKAFGKESRKMLGRAGIIRLCPDEDVAKGLGIAEGIETAMAIIAAGWRAVWACGSLEGLKQFPVLAGIECLTVFSDAKPHEIAGARACADRWPAAGREAILRVPRQGDWNDALALKVST
jgi:putative DNA primase/helicase